MIFDLIQLELLDDFFGLQCDVYTNSMVIEEIHDPDQKEEIQIHLDNRNIKIDDIANDDFIFEVASIHRGLSLTDCSVIDLAIKSQGILLTTDHSLRKISGHFEVEVHGILWVIKILVDECIISSKMAITKLRTYASINSRAPMRDLNDLIRVLEKD